MISQTRSLGGLTRPTATGPGAIALPLITVISWGGSFPLAKIVLHSMNAFYLTAERYALATLVFAAILWAVEGRTSFRFDGQFLRVWVLGSIGIGGFGLLAFLGLTHTRPQNAALIVATMPLLTTLVLWVRNGTRPTRATLAFMLTALLGVALVISRGSVASITGGQVGGWDLLVLLGTLCWVIYTVGASSLPHWSPLRYTTLSAFAGTVVVIAVTGFFTAIGSIVAPALHDTSGATWGIIYLAVPGTAAAVLTWNSSIRRLGAQNTVLFMNLVPIIALTIEIVRGYRASGGEIVGVAVTILALIGNNLWHRQKSKRARTQASDGKLVAA